MKPKKWDGDAHAQKVSRDWSSGWVNENGESANAVLYGSHDHGRGEACRQGREWSQRHTVGRWHMLGESSRRGARHIIGWSKSCAH